MMRLVLALALVTLFVAVPVLGQAEVGKIPVENIRPLEYTRPIWEYVTGGVFLVLVLVIGFKASKRSEGK